MSSLAISIVTHPSGPVERHAELLDHCLASIRRCSPDSPRIVITNNLGSVELFSRVPSLTGEELLLTNERPHGFAANHNEAVRRVSEPFVLILNDDTLVTEGALERLLASIQPDPGVAMVGPRLYADQECSVQIPSTGHRVLTPERALLWRLMRETPLIGMRRLQQVYSELSLSERAEPVLHLQGAAFLVRREAYLAVGGMDEGYHMYREETDLCLSLRRAGWRIMYEPSAAIVHFGGASTGASVYRDVYQESLDRFLRKHYGWRARVVNGLLQPPLLQGLRTVRRLLRRPAQPC